ncbi:hypothetical protein D0T66_07280 [Dysgonomonas sp. 25]|nr:hypothetical protein [Dysgonomonas sp. 25]
MLPRLLRRGYDCIFQEMTLVKRDLAKAPWILLFLFLHLKVEAISKNAASSLVSTRDDKANSYQLTAKSYISVHYLIIILTNYFLL